MKREVGRLRLENGSRAALVGGLLPALALASILIAVSRGAAPKSPPLAYVSNERDGTITVVNTATDEAVKTFRVGGRPRGIQLSPDGRRLYVAVSRPASAQRPTAPDRAATQIADQVVELSAADGRVVARYDVGSDPEQFAVGRGGRRLYVANEDAGTATITDLKTKRVVATLVVGTEPEGVAISPDGRWVYVTSETSNTVSVIDALAGRLKLNFPVGARPRAAAFSPDGARAWVTNENSGTVTVVDARRHQVIHTVARPDGAARPMGVAFSPDGRRVYVANGRGNTVAVFEAASYRLLGLIPVAGRPWGVAVTPDGKKVYTANGLSNDVAVIDAAAGRVVKTVRAGDGPWGVVISPAAAP
jgi:PQQ-dependent catabolism-associated beta-propeller protein